MRKVLSRMFKPDEPPRIFATIVMVREDGRYIVADDWARKSTVEGDRGYMPGLAVIVQGGRIVATGSRKPAAKTIRV